MLDALLARVLGPVLAHSRLSVLFGGVLALLSLALALSVLTFNFDENDLFDASVPVAKERSRFYRAMPAFADPIIVVIGLNRSNGAQAEPAGGADTAMGTAASTAALFDYAAHLAAMLTARPEHFEAVYGPVDKDFLQRHALLYLGPDQRPQLLRDIVRAQPLLGALSAAPGLETLFTLLARLQLAGDTSALAVGQRDRLWIELARVLEAWLVQRRAQFDWQVLLSVPPASQTREHLVLLVKPVVDYTLPDPAGAPVRVLRELIARSPADVAGAKAQYGDSEFDVAITGVPVLAHDDGTHVAEQAGLAGLASVLLVILVLMRALRCWRALLALVYTLTVSLCYTLGLASLTVGHLNAISVAFGVLSIGLGVDFAIHVALRAQARLSQASAGHAQVPAERLDTARSLALGARLAGPPLLLCALTSGSAFLSYLATPFKAMAELGLITAGGLLASMLGALLLLPAAMLSFGAFSTASPQRLVLPDWLGGLCASRSRASLTVAAMAVLGLGASMLAVQVRFDANPLNVRDPNAASVHVLRQLLASNEGATWNMNVLVRGDGERAALEKRLGLAQNTGPEERQAMPSPTGPIRMVRGSETVIPAGQVEAMVQIQATALSLLPGLALLDKQALLAHGPKRDDVAEQVRALLHGLNQAAVPADGPGLSPVAHRLGAALQRLLSDMQDPELAQSRLDALHQDLMSGLIPMLGQLRVMLSPEPIQKQTLPAALYGLSFALDGRERLEIMPNEDLSSPQALQRFVAHVRRAAPDAFGEALVIQSLGDLVVDALQIAMLVSLVAVFCLVWLWTGSVADAGIIVALTLVACVLTLGGCRMLAVSLNFANVIVLPLLLGIGVDTAIHLIHRARDDLEHGPALLSTSTARACFYSAATSLLSFGTLAFATHQGLASLGTVLCLGVISVLAVNLLLLPAILHLTKRGL